jgi:branched-chain amino acid transport system substrate-binding protein
MVERAKGSTKPADLRKIIAMGDVSFDAPEGKVTIDPKSQHMSHTIYLAKVNDDHSISFPYVWHDIKPYWLGEAGADLTKKNPQKQYTPSDPPPKPN